MCVRGQMRTKQRSEWMRKILCDLWYGVFVTIIHIALLLLIFISSALTPAIAKSPELVGKLSWPNH